MIFVAIAVAVVIAASTALYFAHAATFTGTPEVEWFGARIRAEVMIAIFGMLPVSYLLAKHRIEFALIVASVPVGAFFYLLVERAQLLGASRREAAAAAKRQR